MRSVLQVGRRGWRRLTSMRTALVLLFLLAVAAVPGSLLPQTPLDPQKVQTYITDHGAWGRFLDDLGMFDVFGSAWFAAVYLLLFVSLVGCLVPRIRVHVRGLRRKPLPAPRNLGKLPESARLETSASAADYADTARDVLGRRWRVERRSEDSGALTLSAEKGYSRETGNIVFHVALLAALVLIALGRLLQYEGQVIVTQGTGFCNSPGLYDSWKPGRLTAAGDVTPTPFCVTLRHFLATYGPDGEPQQYRADIDYTTTPDGPASDRKRTAIEVNHPLRFDGDRLYLQGHGFAAKVTIRIPGQPVAFQTANFLPSNATTFLSEGVFSANGADGKKQDIAIRALFAPDAVDQNTGGTVTQKSAIVSAAPTPTNPVLSMFVYRGDLNETGLPSSVYSVDTSKMTQLKVASPNLRPGQTTALPGGGSITFDGYVPWVNFQTSHDPVQNYLLIAALAMVVGLFGSLAVRRRRLWIRIAPGSADGAGSPTVVTVGGLARSDSGNFTAEFDALMERLNEAATPVEPALRAGEKETVE